jgi:NitT/TauT family transport system substrate-binding protein
MAQRRTVWTRGSAGLSALKRFSLIFLRVVALGGLLIAPLACKQKETLRVGFNSWPGYEYLYLLKTKGFDRELGFELELLTFNSLADARRSFERGELDVIATTVVETLFAKQNSLIDPKMFYVIDYSDGGDVILAQPSIRSVKELKGKTVGVETGSVCIYGLFRALQLNGMGLDDIKIKALDQDNIFKQMKLKSIEAAVTYVPFSLRLLKERPFNVLFTSRQIPGEMLDVFTATGKVMKERKSDLQKLVKAFDKARQYASQPHSDGFKIMADREGLSEADFTAAILNDLYVVPLADQKKNYFDKDQLQKITDQTAAALFKAGHLSENLTTQGLMENILHE